MNPFDCKISAGQGLRDLLREELVSLSLSSGPSGWNLTVLSTAKSESLGFIKGVVLGENALVQMHDSFNYSNIFSTDTSSPFRKKREASINLDDGMSIDTPSGVSLGIAETIDYDMSYESALAYAKENRLTHRVTSSGVLNALPDQSLVAEDFYRPMKALYARMILVAENMGSSKLYAKITCDPKTYSVGRGDGSLDDWWKYATALQRVKLLSVAKSLDADEILDLPTIAKAVEGISRSPFRTSQD